MAHKIAQEIYFELHRLGLSWQRTCRNPRFWLGAGILAVVAVVMGFVIWAQINYDERLRLLHRTPMECAVLSDPAMVALTLLGVTFVMTALVAAGEIFIWFDRQQGKHPVSAWPMAGYSIASIATGMVAYGLLMRLC